jgi:hypothetical protein
MAPNRRRSVGINIEYYIRGMLCRVNYTEKSELLALLTKHAEGEVWVEKMTDPLTGLRYWENRMPADYTQSWESLVKEFDN